VVVRLEEVWPKKWSSGETHRLPLRAGSGYVSSPPFLRAGAPAKGDATNFLRTFRSTDSSPGDLVKMVSLMPTSSKIHC
jgi:hypothetical protein